MMEVVRSISVNSTWVVHLAWSPWKTTETGSSECSRHAWILIAYPTSLVEATLACATSDGSVHRILISHTNDGRSPISAAISEGINVDRRSVTGLQWIQGIGSDVSSSARSFAEKGLTDDNIS